MDKLKNYRNNEPKKFFNYTIEEIIGNIVTFACLVLPLCCGAIGWAGYAHTHPTIMWNMAITALTFSWIGVLISVVPSYGKFKREWAEKNKLAIPRFIINTSLDIFAFVFVIAVTIYGLSHGDASTHEFITNNATTNLNYFATSYTAVVIVKTMFSWVI